jgi:hypothetical protein
MQLVEQQPAGSFTTQELARLAAYRAAVVAGFYSDWDGTVTTLDTRLLPRLLRERVFTTEERQRLAKLRKQVATGGYADDLPPAPQEEAATQADGRSLAE